MSLFIVEGPRTSAGDEAVLGLTDLARGRIAIAPEPGTTRLTQLSYQILRATGRSVAPDAIPGEARDRMWAVAALAGADVRHLFVLHPDTAPACASGLAQLASDAGASCWFLLDDPHAAWLGDLAPGRRLSFSAFAAEWLVPAPRRAPPERRSPQGPWAAAAPRPLEPSTVTIAYVGGFVEAAAWRPEDDPEVAAERLRGLLGRYSDPDCARSALQGARAPLYALGWRLEVDPARLSGADHGSLLEAEPAAALAGLREWADPLAATATYLLTRWRIRFVDALDLRLRDVAPDGSAVFLDDAWRAIPVEDRPIFKGMLAVRRYAEARPNDFFLDARYLACDDDFSRSPHVLRSLVRPPLAFLELELVEPDLLDRRGPQVRWLLERGVALSWIPRDERARRGPADFPVDAILEQVRDETRFFRGRPSACRCAIEHRAPHRVEVPEWPRRPARQHTPYDTGFRRDVYSRRRVEASPAPQP
jgi:hypothetical protein